MAVSELLKKAMEEVAEKTAYYKQVQKESVTPAKTQKQETAKAPATKPVQTAQSTDNRTTAQKVADSQSAYNDYVGSEEQKKNRAALEEALKTMFPAPGMKVPDILLDKADTKEKELKSVADYYKGQQQAEQDRAVMDADLKEYESWSDEDREQLQKYISSDSKTGNLLVNSNPLLWFGANKSLGDSAKYLYGKYGEEKTKQIASSYSRYLNETEAKKIEEDTKNAVDQGTMSTIGQNILGLGTRLFGGLQATADRFGEALDRDERYLTLAPYTSGDLISLHGNTVTAQTARNIAGEDGGILRQGAAYLYQAGMTMVDSLLRAAAGGGATGGAAIAACNAFSQTVSQASQQGATPEQAYALGAAVAGVEYLSEKIPMDEVFKLAKGGKVNVLKQAFKQTGIEISTEELSLLGSMAAEAAILREKSSYKQQIGYLVANGVSYEEAKAQADRGVWEEVKQTALVSGFAGFLSGSGGAIVGNLTAQPEATVENVQETADAAPVEEAVQPETTSFLDDVAQQLEQEATATAPVELTPGQAAIVNGSQNQPMSLQEAMDSVVESYMPNLPKDQPVQQTEQQRAMQRLTDEVMGVKPEMQEGTTDINKKSGSIATPEPVQADSFTSKTTGGTAPIETAPSLSGDAEASRFTSDNATKIDTVLNDSITEPGAEVKGTGAAEQNFSGKAEYQDLLYEGNVQPDRAGDVRPMEVPKTDTYGRNVSEFVGNAYGAEITPDSMANTIEELVQEGALGFDRRSNQDALNDAAKVIAGSTPATITRRITANIANGKIKDGDIEQAMLLYSHYANKNGKRAQEQAAELMVDLTTMAHMTGRNLQLFKLLRQLTPEGQAYVVKRTVENNVERLIRSGQVKKGYSTEVDPELLSEYQKAAAENARAVSDEQKQQSAEKMQQIQQAIFAAEAAKMPATFKAKWDAWRYMAMLGNIKTQGRNVGGNVLFTPYKEAKDKLASLFEKTMPKDQRTKSFFQDRELVSWAKEDAASNDVKNALKYSAKLGDDVTNAQFAENRKIFDNDALDNVRKFVEKVPGMGDMLFKNGHYARSLAGFLKARGYDAETVRSGQVSDAVMAEARGYAIQEAMKATFNDSNAFSDAFAGIGRKNTDNFWSKALNVAAEGILPFRRTPANIVVRFAEYSPAGLAKGVWDMATKVQKGQVSAAAAVDEIAAGMTGSAAMVLGYFLAKGMMGVKLTGSGTDEDEKRQGHQDYALEFSINGQEYSYKIDWAAPANLPLFVGANIYQMMEGNGENTDVSAFTSILHGMGNMFEPMLALSCMSSLNDLMEGVRYAPEGEALYSAAVDIATSYFTQGIPALARQAYQASQKNKQTTFANSADPTIRDLQKLGANVPFVGAAFQTDKVNAWGETETTESGVMRAINAFVNPGTKKAIDNGDLEREITRLNQAQNLNVSPPVADKTVNYTDTNGKTHKGQRLTEEQYQTMAKTQGQTAAKLLDRIIKTSDYKAMTDQQKAYAIEAVYQYAQEQGKIAAISDYHSEADAWIKEVADGDISAFIKRGASGPLRNAVDNTVAAISNGWKVTGADKKAMEETYSSYTKLSDEAKQQVRDGATGDTDKYLKVRDAGVDTASYIKAVEAVEALKPEGEHKDVVPGQRWEAALEGGTTNEAKDALVKAYMDDYDPESSSPDKTELKYDYLRQELNRSPEDAIAIIRAQQSGNKDAKMAKWAAMGYTKAECDILWNLFGSTSKTKAIDVVSWHNSKTE